jgi:hypothetical protein
MTEHPPGTKADGAWYEIRLQGRLTSRWAVRFEGMTLTALDDGTTVLHGHLADQAALHGLLRTLGDLAIPLLSVEQHAGDHFSATDPTDTTHDVQGN